MLYYFRGRLNYHSKNKTLKLLAYVWIAQNIFMILSTAYRNNMYIEESGISYKKIGLYVYLMLSGRINLTGSAAQNLAVFKQNTGGSLKILALVLAIFAGISLVLQLIQNIKK